MRRIMAWLGATVAGLVLLFSYRTSTMSTPAANAVTTSGTTGTSDGNGTYEGSVAQTRWGPVQVTIKVSGGKITSVDVPIYPSGNGRDQEINAVALPILTQETLDAQSAGIDTVSGATVTSDGYKESLQAAIDSAHLS
ncbi:FMN-binding protein [Streptosporangiaceae bacterium NEAU-GS5]|nr:FMN-binding protein [Streptosporangiaceae bacterium NEAU-GS5]